MVSVKACDNNIAELVNISSKKNLKIQKGRVNQNKRHTYKEWPTKHYTGNNTNSLINSGAPFAGIVDTFLLELYFQDVIPVCF